MSKENAIQLKSDETQAIALKHENESLKSDILKKEKETIIQVENLKKKKF